MTISHLNIQVGKGKLDEVTNWYLAVLAPLGYKKHHDLRPNHPVIGIGARYPIFWIVECPEMSVSAEKQKLNEKLHIAFYSNSRQTVRDFYNLALKSGGRDNGPPGLRVQYTSTYYAAYVFDPEGRNIEVHCMTPAFMSEPGQWNILMTSTGVVATLGLAFFANYMGYTGYLSGLI